MTIDVEALSQKKNIYISRKYLSHMNYKYGWISC